MQGQVSESYRDGGYAWCRGAPRRTIQEKVKMGIGIAKGMTVRL